MQKTMLHKVFSMSLALLVLLSTFSFKIEAHFCGPKIVDVAVFSKVKPCCNSTLKTVTELQFTKTSCCTNKIISVDGLNQFKVVSFTNDISIEKVFEAASRITSESLQLVESLSSDYFNYSPPDLIMNHLVEHQVFLI